MYNDILGSVTNDDDETALLFLDSIAYERWDARVDGLARHCYSVPASLRLKLRLAIENCVGPRLRTVCDCRNKFVFDRNISPNLPRETFPAKALITKAKGGESFTKSTKSSSNGASSAARRLDGSTEYCDTSRLVVQFPSLVSSSVHHRHTHLYMVAVSTVAVLCYHIRVADRCA